ncbi:MAG: 50S ribosomal protein L10 [Actinomycetota bacterium]|nr:50S ribosomal protein L10 [Actinomycetota bacterium]
MGEPRAEKIAVVEEVQEKFSTSDAVVLTEYRGLDVPALAALRASLREAGGEYKVYKNTLARFAIEELGLDLGDLLTGPTAIAFTGEQPDGSAGDPVSLAKALKDFAKSNDSLVIKGGLLDQQRLTAEEISNLAEIAPRGVLLAQLAGAMAAPMQQFAALLQALPQNMAYALQALITQSGVPDVSSADEETDAADAADEVAVADEADAEVADEASADEETDAADAADEVAVADEADAEVADEASADDATDTDNKEEE